MKTYTVTLVNSDSEIINAWTVGAGTQAEIEDLFNREGGEADGFDTFVETDGKGKLEDLGAAIAHWVRIQK